MNLQIIYHAYKKAQHRKLFSEFRLTVINVFCILSCSDACKRKAPWAVLPLLPTRPPAAAASTGSSGRMLPRRQRSSSCCCWGRGMPEKAPSWSRFVTICNKARVKYHAHHIHRNVTFCSGTGAWLLFLFYNNNFCFAKPHMKVLLVFCDFFPC